MKRDWRSKRSLGDIIRPKAKQVLKAVTLKWPNGFVVRVHTGAKGEDAIWLARALNHLATVHERISNAQRD